MKGAVRVMTHSQFTIGRAPECEFVIANDPKCSRRQAGVRVTSRGCEIMSLNDKNPVLVNGREIETATLNDGDVVTFGDTEVQFAFGAGPAQMEAPARQMAANPAAPTQLAMQTQMMPYQGMPAPGRPRGRAKSRKPQGNSKRFLIYGVIALVVGYLILSDTKKKKEEFGLRTEQQMNADIESATKIKEARENENAKRLDTSLTSRQAQENYVRGFRDYRKGQYERSLESFQACLALDPSHVLCNRYLRLSQRKFNEMIQYYVLLGRKYRDQNQFASCRAAFRNVMVMVKDANNETYKLAKANYEACNAFIEGRF
jgi:hypothetical protein